MNSNYYVNLGHLILITNMLSDIDLPSAYRSNSNVWIQQFMNIPTTSSQRKSSVIRLFGRTINFQVHLHPPSTSSAYKKLRLIISHQAQVKEILPRPEVLAFFTYLFSSHHTSGSRRFLCHYIQRSFHLFWFAYRVGMPFLVPSPGCPLLCLPAARRTNGTEWEDEKQRKHSLTQKRPQTQSVSGALIPVVGAPLRRPSVVEDPLWFELCGGPTTEDGNGLCLVESSLHTALIMARRVKRANERALRIMFMILNDEKVD